MKRIDKIYNYILENSKTFNREKFLANKGFSAQEIGDSLGILRNNVSKELNTLCREKKIIKIKNRPVLYFDRNHLENILLIKLTENLDEISDINTLDSLTNAIIEDDQSPFNYLIGANSSLKNQIEQAKAALMYPPNGLHTLIIGNIGVGKSLFAKVMYDYSKYMNKLPTDAPFIVFNCADYTNNPQLLLSNIFGHIKGAFTGSEKEEDGIISKTNGGILFLDEIHRLPYEYQKMIFCFMNTGTYSKLGETDRIRNAKILLICATTEDPNSTLLNTFIRKIPITISMPNFDERPIDDQIKLLHNFLLKEALMINTSIRISSKAIKALIGSTSYGNVGQLKSNVQLACAKGFLNYVKTDECVDIDLNTLPPNIETGIITFKNKFKDNAAVWNIIPNTITIQPNGNKTFLESDTYEPPFNIYNIIEHKASALKEEGLSAEDIKSFLTTDVNIHLKQFYARLKSYPHRRNALLKIVDNNIIDFTEEIKILVENRLGKKLSERFIYVISLHLSALFNRMQKKTASYSSHMELEISIDSKEYKTATEIHALIETRYNLIIPPVEIYSLTSLLISIQEPSPQERVGIVVAAHGLSTATSIVSVAKKLFDVNNVLAADIPFELTTANTLDIIIEKVKAVDEGKGVLLLVDIGYLNNLGDVITEKTTILTRNINLVSTPTVLEAVRKCSLSHTDIYSVYSYLSNDFMGYKYS